MHVHVQRTMQAWAALGMVTVHLPLLKECFPAIPDMCKLVENRQYIDDMPLGLVQMRCCIVTYCYSYRTFCIVVSEVSSVSCISCTRSIKCQLYQKYQVSGARNYRCIMDLFRCIRIYCCIMNLCRCQVSGVSEFIVVSEVSSVRGVDDLNAGYKIRYTCLQLSPFRRFDRGISGRPGAFVFLPR